MSVPGRLERDVRYGVGVIQRTPDVVFELGGRRVLLVCGRRSFEASGADGMLPSLAASAEVRRWSDFAPNTDAVDLLHGLMITAEFQPDVVLGVGGGSVMDMAKLLCAFNGLTDEAKLHETIRSGETVNFRQPRLVLAPTTSGTGSEATHFAVVYIGDEKYSVGGPALRPDVVILDPSLTMSGSPYQRATSGIDAVCQAIESLWAVGATDESRRYARHALGILLPAIETFVNAPEEASARAMAIGSHLAGRAIDISKTTAPHALSYGITKRYGVSHGHAVALTLGAFIEAHGTVRNSSLQPSVADTQHAEAMRTIYEAFGVEGPRQARQHFASLMDQIGLARHLSDVAIATREQVRELAAAVNVERLGNNPVRFSAEALAAVLEAADAPYGPRQGAIGRA